MAAAWWQFRHEKLKLHVLAARMRNEGVTRAILTIATAVIAVVVGLSAYPLPHRVNSQVNAATPSQTLSSITLPVSGMDCAICAVPIKARLHDLPGHGPRYGKREIQPGQSEAGGFSHGNQLDWLQGDPAQGVGRDAKNPGVQNEGQKQIRNAEKVTTKFGFGSV